MQADTQNSSTSTKDRIASLKSVFTKFRVTPYCTGTIPLEANVSTIFYRSGDKAEYVLQRSNLQFYRLPVLQKKDL